MSAHRMLFGRTPLIRPGVCRFSAQIARGRNP
jgi:hypothetical protein